MSYFTALEDNLISICNDIFSGNIDNSHIILENPNAPEPDGDYVSIGIRNVVSKSQFSQTSVLDTNNGLRHRKEYEALVDFNIYGTSAYENVTGLEQSFETEDTRQALWDLGLSVKRVGDVKRLPTKRETKWVNRGLLPVYFYFAYEWDEIVNDTIESVPTDTNQIIPN